MQKEEKALTPGLHPEVPVERQRMLLRPWLQLHLELADIPGLEWVDEDKTLFRIPWKHKSKGNWTSAHGAVFVEWAKNTGRFHEEYDTAPNYAHLKTRLRCAINKAQDIEEVESLSNMKAFEPYRVYRFLPRPDRRFSDFGTLAIPRKRSMGGAKSEKGGWTITHEKDEVPTKRKRLSTETKEQGRMSHPNIVQRLVQRLVTEDGTQVDVVREEEVEAVYMDHEETASPDNEQGVSSGYDEEQEELNVPIPETVVELEAEEQVVEVVTQNDQKGVYIIQPEVDVSRSKAGGIEALVEAAQIAAAGEASSHSSVKKGGQHHATYTHIKNKPGPVVDLSTNKKQVMNGSRYELETTNLIASPSVSNKSTNPLADRARAEVMDLSKKSTDGRSKSDAVNLTLKKSAAEPEAMNLSVKEEYNDYEGGCFTEEDLNVTLNEIIAEKQELEAKAKSLNAKEQALIEWELRLVEWDKSLQVQQNALKSAQQAEQQTNPASQPSSVVVSDSVEEQETRVSFYEDNEGDGLRVPLTIQQPQHQGSMIRQILLSGRAMKPADSQAISTDAGVAVKRSEATHQAPAKRQVIIPVTGGKDVRPIIQRQGRRLVVVPTVETSPRFVISNEKEGLSMLSDVASGSEETFVLINEDGQELIGERILPALSKHAEGQSQVLYVHPKVTAANSPSSTANLSMSELSPAITDMLSKPTRLSNSVKSTAISASTSQSDMVESKKPVSTSSVSQHVVASEAVSISGITKLTTKQSSSQVFVLKEDTKPDCKGQQDLGEGSPRVVWKVQPRDSSNDKEMEKEKLIWTDRSSKTASKEGPQASSSSGQDIATKASSVVKNRESGIVVNRDEPRPAACVEDQAVNSPVSSGVESPETRYASDTTIKVVVQKNPENNSVLNIDCVIKDEDRE